MHRRAHLEALSLKCSGGRIAGFSGYSVSNSVQAGETRIRHRVRRINHILEVSFTIDLRDEVPGRSVKDSEQRSESTGCW